MGIRRLNHAVIYVGDLRASIRFYRDVLGFSSVHELAGAAFLRAEHSSNDHDLGLFEVSSGAAASRAGRGGVGLYHLAWSVRTLGELAALRRKLAQAGALVGESDHVVSKSLYGADPDGLEFELGWFVPRKKITPEMAQEVTVRPLDLDAEIAAWGDELLGAA